jgi:hypothetical protein
MSFPPTPTVTCTRSCASPQLAIAVNGVVLLSAYLTYMDPWQRVINVVGSTVFGVSAALIGNMVPWVDLAFHRVTSLAKSRARETFSCTAALATSLAAVAYSDVVHDTTMRHNNNSNNSSSSSSGCVLGTSPRHRQSSCSLFL